MNQPLPPQQAEGSALSATYKFGRYGIAGLVATAVHYLLMSVLIHQTFSPTVATLLGSAAGLIAAHQINHRWTFKSGATLSQTGGRFLVVGLSSMTINLMAFATLSALGHSLVVAQLGATAVTFIAGYWGNLRWSFSGANQ